MKIDEFQQELLFFVRNTTEPIIAQNVAYYLKIKIEEAQTHLETLGNKNIVILDSDDEGNLVFNMPNTPRKDNSKMAMAHFFPETTSSGPNFKKKSDSKTYFIGKKRSLIALIFLSFITFGIYSIVWYYSIWDEAKLHSEKVPFGGFVAILLAMIPFVNIWVYYQMANNIILMEEEDNFRTRTFSSRGEIVILILLSIFIIPALILLAKINEGMNRHWDYHILH
ncbi:DUF4234 domain-containing protein [bacterium]|nr:DUF4234 domain-containing protein [bacterium]